MKLSTIRLIGWIEAISFLALLVVAMPLKYMADQPLGVRILGPFHGVLFIVFGVMVLSAYIDKKLNKKLVILCAIGALIPFGPVLYHKQLSDSESPANSPETESSNSPQSS